MAGTSGHKNALDFMGVEVLLLNVVGFLGIFIPQCFAWVCMWVCVSERDRERRQRETERGRYREEGTERDLTHRDNLCEDALHTLKFCINMKFYYLFTDNSDLYSICNFIDL